MENLVHENCHGFQTNHLFVLLGMGVFGVLMNIVTLWYLKKNFNLQQTMNQALFMDLCIIITST